MITFRGVFVVGVAAFAFLLARLTQVGWLYLLDAILWGAILLSVVVPWMAVSGLSVRRRLVRSGGNPGSPGPTEGEEVQIQLTLENPRAWSRYFLSLTYECAFAPPEERSQRMYVPRLASSSSLSLASEVECYRRGPYELGPVAVESRAPFGLFRRKRHLPDPLSVLVYPQVHRLERLPLVEGMQGTTARPRRAREGQEIAGSRRYMPGDPLRHIHWRNSARAGRPMVKEFEDSQENTLDIHFDSSQDLGTEKETVLEYSIKLAASAAAHITMAGGQVRMRTGRIEGREMPWAALLKELALLEPGRGPGLPTLLASPSGGSRTLALVSESDLVGIEELERRASQMPGPVVVVLAGFGDTPDGDQALERLRRTGASAIVCRQGDLTGGLRSLENTWPASTRAGVTPYLSPPIHGGRT